MVRTNYFQRFAVLMMGFFASFLAFAQEKTAELNINTTETTKTESVDQSWMSSPLVWVIGAVLLLLLLALIFRGNGNRNR